jgi:hypothetical protein
VVRNVLSIAPRRAGGMAQWFVSFSWRPWGLRDLARGWYLERSWRRS